MRSSLKSLSMALIAASAIYSSGVMAADKDTKSDNLRPVGEAVDCIYRPSIQHTEVRNDRTIDFHMNGSKIYRNTLPNSCPSLGSERKFSYKTSISQLCSVAIITVLHYMGGDRHSVVSGQRMSGLVDPVGCVVIKKQKQRRLTDRKTTHNTS